MRPGTMLESLAWAVRRTRRDAGVARHVLAIDAGVSPETIARLERADAWPRDPEGIVRAVATRAGIDEREVWLAAVNAWGAEVR